MLERGYAPSIPVEDAQKLPRMGRWSFLRLSGGMVEEILNTEPEKVCAFICIEIHSLKKCTLYVLKLAKLPQVIEQLKVEDWEVHFAIEMGVVSDQVTKKVVILDDF